jgi:ribosomal protein S6
MRLNEDVMRYLTVRRKELAKGPSAIIDKNSNDNDRFESFEEEVA